MTARETADPGVAAPPNGGPARRTLDVSRFGGGVASDSQHAALRASVRQLGQLLGEALTRHEGPELLALVEQVRATAREPGDEALHRLLAGVDDATAVVLARAFTAYFQLVNVTEQLHRYQELTTGEETPLEGTVRRLG
jgi:phosphoenolpyruvate carboxylase